jgi:intermediate cleaving peptidase 55
MVQGRLSSTLITYPGLSSTTRTTFADAKEHFAFDESLPFHTLPRMLRSLIPVYDNIYVDVLNPPSRRSSPRSILKYLSPSSEQRSEYDAIMEALNRSRRKSLAPIVAKLRSIKSPSEQAVMRAAADVSGTAFAKVDTPSTSLVHENDLTILFADDAIHPA